MATTIKLKNSVTTTNAPSSLAQGEVAINVTDKKVWVGNAATTPVQLLGTGADGTFTNVSVSGVASFADGTVSLPSITNTGDTNTGIFFPVADTIAFTEGGVESMRLDSSGNLGIGTSSPDARLDVSGTSRTRIDVSTSTVINTVTNAAANAYATLRIDPADYQFYTNASEKMRIDSSGNVGIGTSNPSYPLDVLSNSSAIGISIRGRSADNVSLYNFTSNNGATQYGYVLGSLAELRLAQNGSNYITAFTNGSERMRIDSSGNVGIGTSSPDQRLDVRGSGAISLKAQSSDGSAQVILNSASGSISYVNYGQTGANSLAFYDSNAGAERMRINAGAPILCLAGGNTSATGTGIAFPASQNASSDANTLDDYEEGTFTATLTGDVSNPTTPVTVNAKYTKIGNVVTIAIGYENVNTSGASGAVSIQGLPFAPSDFRAVGTVGFYVGVNFTGTLIGIVSTGATNLEYYSINSGGIWTPATHNAGSARYFWATMTYRH
jgi:hypothetical protein